MSASEYLDEFLLSRKVMGVSPGTIHFYRIKLGRFLSEVDPDTARRKDIDSFLLQFENMGNRNCYHRAIKTFFNWRYETYNLPSPMKYIKAPKIPKLILPTLTKEEVQILIDATESMTDPVRNKAIISLFVESGLRWSEHANVRSKDINWNNRTIKVLGKGGKEGLAPFGETTENFLRAWLVQYQTGNGNIWGIDKWGITSMLRRLKEETGLPCNPHVFRRTFACLLRQAGVDVLTIKELGRWESVEMVERYTRAFTFDDSLKFYKGPLS